MLEDGLNETHPIIQAASTPDEINELFDPISYEKVMCAVYVFGGCMLICLKLCDTVIGNAF